MNSHLPTKVIHLGSWEQHQDDICSGKVGLLDLQQGTAIAASCQPSALPVATLLCSCYSSFGLKGAPSEYLIQMMMLQALMSYSPMKRVAGTAVFFASVEEQGK